MKKPKLELVDGDIVIAAKLIKIALDENLSFLDDEYVVKKSSIGKVVKKFPIANEPGSFIYFVNWGGGKRWWHDLKELGLVLNQDLVLK